ncbi:MAG: hypothetical protein KC456_04815 [Flavobacteriales bacterium]|jgi:hypothetical protein|nr:hypothetical protein [Flavobacteriales bacterium]
MDDPGSLIYVAFLAISIIAGFINSQKKKRAAQDALEGVGQEDSDSAPSAVEISQMIDLERVAQKEAIAKLQELSVKKAKSKRHDFKRTRTKQIIEVEEEEAYSGHPLFDITDEFDARKAVIYSEILNPPHL